MYVRLLALHVLLNLCLFYVKRSVYVKCNKSLHRYYYYYAECVASPSRRHFDAFRTAPSSSSAGQSGISQVLGLRPKFLLGSCLYESPLASDPLLYSFSSVRWGTPSACPGGVDFSSGLSVGKFLAPRRIPELRKISLSGNKLPDRG